MIAGGVLARMILALALLASAVQTDARQSAGHALPEPADRSSEFFESLLQPGDFVFRRGYGMVSDQIVRILGGSKALSHSGVLVGGGDDEWLVIHTVSSALSELDGIRIEPLASFIADARPGSVSFVRLIGPFSQGQQMAEAAKSLLAEDRPFDHQFELGTHALYCSELLWTLLPPEVRERVTRQHPSLGILLFETFFDEQFFQIVLPPEGAGYRD